MRMVKGLYLDCGYLGNELVGSKYSVISKKKKKKKTPVTSQSQLYNNFS